MLFDLGNLHQDERDFANAEAAFREVAKILVERREALLESGPYEQGNDQPTCPPLVAIAWCGAGANDRTGWFRDGPPWAM